MLHASDLAPLCCVYPQRRSLPQVLSDMASPILHHVSTAERNWKGQNTGAPLAVIKGLVGQVEKLVGKFPSSTLYGKNCPDTHTHTHTHAHTHYSEYDNLCCNFVTRRRGPLNAGGPLWIAQPAQSIAFSKAFDVVDHGILVSNLSRLNIPPCILHWISYFLTGRTQQVKYATKLSAFQPINMGIVQGSGLGPT